MSQKIYLHIKEPCHENWEAMSPARQGRFCESCAKQVVDFSWMSDQQILDVLSKAAGKTCGRFSGSQLEKPVEPEIPYSLKPYKIVLSSLVPLLVMAGDVSGQNKVSKGEVTTQTKAAFKNLLMGDTVMVPTDDSVVMGKISVKTDDKQQQSPKTEPVKEFNVKGKIVKKNVATLPHAAGVKNPHKKNVADNLLKSFVKPAQVNTVIIATPIVDHDKEYLHNTLEPVTVTGFASQSLVGIAGGISIVRTVTRADTAKTFVQKLFNNDMFKAFPNPASKGQNVHLSFRKEGDYMIQLFDNSGKLYMEKQVLLAGKETISQLTIPATISSGVYYLKAVNTSVKKSFIEKIIVD